MRLWLCGFTCGNTYFRVDIESPLKVVAWYVTRLALVRVVSRLLTTALSQDHLVYNITSALRKAFGSPSQSIRTQKRSVNKPLSELCSKNEDQVLKI